MQKFVEYIYHQELFSTDQEHDIRPVDIFDVTTVDVPSNAIGFMFFSAKNMKNAHKNIKRRNSRHPTYHLADPESVIMINSIRKAGYRFDAWAENVEKLLGGGITEEKLIQAFTDPVDNDEALELRESNDMLESLFPGQAFGSRGDVMAAFVADSMEKAGCHRAIGQWPGNLYGVPDKDVILDMHTRQIISPACKA